jgi:hypothetical protein
MLCRRQCNKAYKSKGVGNHTHASGRLGQGCRFLRGVKNWSEWGCTQQQQQQQQQQPLLLSHRLRQQLL